MTPFQKPPAGMNSLIVDQLSPGEKLLWSGRPRQGIVLRRSDGFFIPFSLVWGVPVIVIMTQVARKGTSGAWPLLEIGFAGFALYLIVGRFFVDAWQRTHTAYGVTSERILIVNGGPSTTVTSLPLGMLPQIRMNVNADATGTIAFGPGNMHVAANGSLSGSRNLPATMFEIIDDAPGVYAIIREAQERLGSREPVAE